MGFIRATFSGLVILASLAAATTASTQDAPPDKVTIMAHRGTSPDFAPVALPRYKLTDLGAISGAPYSRAYGVNNKGQIVGQVATVSVAKVEAHAVLWEDGKARAIAMPGGLPYGAARGINDAGDVVGGSEIQNYGSNGFHFMGLSDKAYLWQSGKTTPLATSSDSTYEFDPQSHAYAINAHGQIVGEAGRQAVIWNAGKQTTLKSPPKFRQSSAFAVNDRGDVAGIVFDEQGDRQAALWHDGKVELLGLPAGDDQSVVGGINDLGQIAGSSGKNGFYWNQPFLWEKGRMTMLPPLDGDTFDNEVTGINNHGAVVGCGTRDGKMNAVLWDKGKLYDLNDLIPDGSGLVLMKAIAINDRGEIVGEARDSSIQIHAFLLTPNAKK